MNTNCTSIRDRRDLGAFIPANLDDYPLNPYEFRLYAHIVRRAGRSGCFESVGNMAKHCQMNEKTAFKALHLLIHAGLLEQEYRQGKTAIYNLTPDSEWITAEKLPKLRKMPTPISGGTTTPISGGTTTPISGGTTTPISGGTTTPISGGTPPPYQGDKGSTSKEQPIKVLPIKEEERISPRLELTEVEVEISKRAEAPLVEIQDNYEDSTNENDTLEDNFSAAAEPKILKEIERSIYDWRVRPWMETATTFKPEMIKAVFTCNVDWYSLPGSKTPNLKKISDRLRRLDSALAALNAGAIAAWGELQTYWITAKAISNPEVQQAFTQAAAMNKQTSLQLELEAKKQRIAAAIADL